MNTDEPYEVYLDSWDAIEYDDDAEHWVNNPLITPKNKVAMFDEAIERAKREGVKEAIEYLKTTPAVLLSGKGGAYELLEEWVQND